MTNPQYMVNMSHWGRDLTDAEAVELYEKGVRIVSPGCGPGSFGWYCRQQAGVALANGLSLIPYHYIEHGLRRARYGDDYASVEGWLGAGIAQYADLPVNWVVVDIEDRVSGQEVGPAAVRAEITHMLNVLVRHGYVPIIYTARYVWNELTDYWDGPALAGVPLWDAEYDGDPYNGFNPYGGWSRAAIHQWRDTTEIGGQSLQPNYVEPWFIATFGTEEEDEMTPAEKQMLEDVFLRTGGAVGTGFDLLNSINQHNTVLHMLIDARANGAFDDDRESVAEALRAAAEQLDPTDGN